MRLVKRRFERCFDCVAAYALPSPFAPSTFGLFQMILNLKSLPKDSMFLKFGSSFKSAHKFHSWTLSLPSPFAWCVALGFSTSRTCLRTYTDISIPIFQSLLSFRPSMIDVMRWHELRVEADRPLYGSTVAEKRCFSIFSFFFLYHHIESHFNFHTTQNYFKMAPKTTYLDMVSKQPSLSPHATASMLGCARAKVARLFIISHQSFVLDSSIYNSEMGRTRVSIDHHIILK